MCDLYYRTSLQYLLLIVISQSLSTSSFPTIQSFVSKEIDLKYGKSHVMVDALRTRMIVVLWESDVISGQVDEIERRKAKSSPTSYHVTPPSVPSRESDFQNWPYIHIDLQLSGTLLSVSSLTKSLNPQLQPNNFGHDLGQRSYRFSNERE